MTRRSFLLLLALALVAAVPANQPGKDSFSHIGTVSAQQAPGHFGSTRFPDIEVDKSDHVYVLMSVATKPAGAGTPGSQIFFAMSKDKGSNWNNLPFTKNLSKSKGEAFGPSLAINMNGKTRAYATYHDTAPGNTQAFMVKSKKGSKFKKAFNITPHDGGAFSPRVAVDSIEQVSVVWGDTLEARKRVVFVRSLDQGSTFSDPVDVSRSSGDAFEPEIAVDKNDAINVAWEDTATGTSVIMFARSTDRGDSFSEPVRVSSLDEKANEANIAVDSLGNIHVVWVGESGDTLQAFYARSTDGGITFSEPVNLSNVEGADIHKLVIATFNENVYVAYNNEANNSRQVFLVKSRDSGETFSEPVRVSNADRTKGRAHSPALAVDSTGLLHIVWIDSSVVGQDEGLLFYSNSANGNRFSTQQLILAALP